MAQASPSTNNTKFIRALQGRTDPIPPIWLMRQAGRYLPEYRKVRAEAGSFLDLCYNSDKAAEVTLQPIDRFDLDAAILFADILLIPHAFGQGLRFVEGEGPRLEPVMTHDMIGGFRQQNIHETLSPVYETVAKVRASLPETKSLIGFAGAPWTVATYMLAGGPMKDPAALRALHYQQPQFLADLISLIVEATIEYLSRQIEAGANAVQLFDTWAGGLPPQVLDAVSVRPLSNIASALKKRFPHIPVILFPKGVGPMIRTYADLGDCDGVGIDYSMPPAWARDNLPSHTTIQGALDPLLVVKGGKEMEEGIYTYLDTFANRPYVFNLGHGLTPQTPPENVGRLVDIIRNRG